MGAKGESEKTVDGEITDEENAAKEAANETMSADVSRCSAKEHKADKPQPLTHNEVVLRDAVAGMMRENGMEVIGDAEGQKVLDLANKKNVSKGIKLAIDSINEETDETSTANERISSRQTEVSSDSGANLDNRIEFIAVR